MIQRFEQLDEEKKKRIINAALKEFATNGFNKASTNIIVKEAGISKGLIFHYFESKVNLYVYLFDYCSQLISKELDGTVDFENGDILERIQDIIAKKMYLIQKYPNIFEFIKNSYCDSSIPIKEMALKKQERASKDVQLNFLTNIDYAYFKEGLDMEKTIVTIYSTIENISMSAIKKKNTTVEELIKQLDDYIHYFKLLFYK